ncbi:MAG: aminodeoxychorismate synthase component I [Deltaproteobacteria bacterium]|nr:aminodeoxychorismate synthase component I [Deltaproteobacteria bacterium]
MILLVDHYDSYTQNLAHLIARVTGALPHIERCDAITADAVAKMRPEAIVLSPGPGRPDVPRDVGASAAIVAQQATTPMLGVCLGHQIIAHVYGARVARAAHPLHGRTSPIAHSGRLFADLPRDFQAMRYHSLAVQEPMPSALIVTARADDSEVMAIEHRARPHFGVQFHPESIASEHGAEILERFFRIANVQRRSLKAKTPPPPRKAEGQVASAPLRIPFRSPADVFAALFADAPHAFLLEDAGPEPRYSFLGTGSPARPNALATLITNPERDAACADLPFTGGLVGAVDYERRAPALLEANEVLACDHRAQTFRVCVTATSRDRASVRAKELASAWSEAVERARPEPAATGESRGAFRCDRAAYEAKVRECISLIAAGEAYELCLTNRFSGTTSFTPWQLYRRLVARSPSRYAAFLRDGARSIVSSSPERLLHVDAETRIAETRPIKGTRPRGENPAADRALEEALRTSGKDRAENLMIVDVARHDLGGVSVASGVSVPRLLEVEAHPTLFQLVSTVRAELDGAAPDAILAAVFPPASMTGAPKLRAIEHLATLEAAPRGVYSGALGYFDRGGQIDLSVVIRTLVCEGGAFSFGVGGAVLLDSDPAAEWDETLVKARAMLGALQLAKLA